MSPDTAAPEEPDAGGAAPAPASAAPPPPVETAPGTPADTVTAPPAGSAEPTGGHAVSAARGEVTDHDLSSSLRDIPLRVGAELGRATFPLAQAVDLGPGVVIELDRASDDPIDLCINGQRFATGQLLLIDQTEWAIRIEHVFEVDPAADYSSRASGT